MDFAFSVENAKFDLIGSVQLCKVEIQDKYTIIKQIVL